MQMAENAELSEDYLRRLAATQPKNLPPELDLFDEETSRAGLALNKAAYSLKHEEQRALFERDLEAWMAQFDLTEQERELIRRREWIDLWRHGMSIYTMIKLIGVTGTPLVEIGKQMREKGTRDMSTRAGEES
jgi:protocatechuate 4,5-dioxygenase alpha chain